MRITPIQLFKACDYIPVVSSATNLITLIAKGVFLLMGNQRNPGSFRAYAMDKSLSRCLAHIFLPGVANVAFAIYNHRSKSHASLSKLPPASPQSLFSFLGIDDRRLPSLQYVLDDDHLSIHFNDMPHPIMKGFDIYGREFFTFRIQITSPTHATAYRTALILYQGAPSKRSGWQSFIPGFHPNPFTVDPFDFANIPTKHAGFLSLKHLINGMKVYDKDLTSYKLV